MQGEVTIQYNKLHAEASQGKSLDIILKKVKHRLVENMSSTTADALGLSRAILCNDGLVKKLAELQRIEVMYRGMVEHTQRLLRAYLELLRVIKVFGETFAQIGVREPQPRASLAFTQFADYHRAIEKRGVEMVKQLKPVSRPFAVHQAHSNAKNLKYFVSNHFADTIRPWNVPLQSYTRYEADDWEMCGCKI